jgi:multiple sugar transport system ATP-binding protein
MAQITLDGLSKQYPNGVLAVDALDLTIGDGEFFALLGPSGCGKTTLLRTVAGLENATGGRLLLGEKDVTSLPPGKRDIAMVFQDYALFPHMDVADNIGYPLRIRGQRKVGRRAKAMQTGQGLGLDALMERRPAQLSGGQQQRVALARAMACQPSVFLFDEPLSNLDARLRLEARTFLKKLQKDLGVTTIFVTHDQAEALAMADRMAVMEAGRIRQVGTPSEVFHRPANTFVANFIGSAPMNLLAGEISIGGVQIAGSTVAVPAGTPSLPSGTPVLLGARPEYVDLVAAGTTGALSGTVTIVENLGATALVSVQVADPTGNSSDSFTDPVVGLTVQVMVAEGDEPAIGSGLGVVHQSARSLLYDAESGDLLSGTGSGSGSGTVAGAAGERAAAKSLTAR